MKTATPTTERRFTRLPRALGGRREPIASPLPPRVDLATAPPRFGAMVDSVLSTGHLSDEQLEWLERDSEMALRLQSYLENRHVCVPHRLRELAGPASYYWV